MPLALHCPISDSVHDGLLELTSLFCFLLFAFLSMLIGIVTVVVVIMAVAIF